MSYAIVILQMYFVRIWLEGRVGYPDARKGLHGSIRRKYLATCAADYPCNFVSVVLWLTQGHPVGVD